MAKSGSIAWAAWNCSRACFQPKLCRIATPRRKWAWASPVADVGKVMTPTSSNWACTAGGAAKEARIRAAAATAPGTVVLILFMAIILMLRPLPRPCCSVPSLQ